MTRALLIPLRSFEGMSRLSPILGASERRAFARTLADGLVMAAVGAELTTYIVTPDSDVRSWAKSNNLGVLDDPGAGLNVASSLAVDAINGRPWMVAHADLPNVTAVSLTRVAEAAGDGTALVPSIDGGTNVIAHTGSFPFSFGPGSFHRHLASFPDAVVLPGAALSMDVDTPAHLVALARTGAAPSLSEG